MHSFKLLPVTQLIRTEAAPVDVANIPVLLVNFHTSQGVTYNWGCLAHRSARCMIWWPDMDSSLSSDACVGSWGLQVSLIDRGWGGGQDSSTENLRKTDPKTSIGPSSVLYIIQVKLYSVCFFVCSFLEHLQKVYLRESQLFRFCFVTSNLGPSQHTGVPSASNTGTQAITTKPDGGHVACVAFWPDFWSL